MVHATNHEIGETVPITETSMVATMPRQRMRPPIPLVALARGVARTAHIGQRDAFGEDLFAGTLTGVARRLRLTYPHVQAAAWLHLAVARTEYTFDTLRVAGIPERVVALVEALTPHRGEGLIEHAVRVAHHAEARLVAMAAATDQMIRLHALIERHPGDEALTRARMQTCADVRDVLVRAELEGQP